MFRFEKGPKVYEIGGIKLGGQPGDYPTIACFSIFQESDKLFDKGARRKGFNEKRAEELLKTADKFYEETGVPPMADIVASPGEKFNKYIDFVTSVSKMPFCVDAIQMKTKLDGAAYCAEKGLLDRMFYNSITVWEEDLATEIKEISQIGVKHVLLVAFDVNDQMPTGRVTGAQKLLDAIEKAGAEFETSIGGSSQSVEPIVVGMCRADLFVMPAAGVQVVVDAVDAGSFQTLSLNGGEEPQAATDVQVGLGLDLLHNPGHMFNFSVVGPPATGYDAVVVRLGFHGLAGAGEQFLGI